MKCRTCQELLSPWMDGDLPPRKAREMAAHVEACVVCAAVRDDFAAMAERLRQMGSWDDSRAGGGAREARREAPGEDPFERMWDRIDAALDADEAAGRRAARAPSPWRRFPMLAPATAGALLLSASIGGAALQRVRQRAAQAGDEALLREAEAAVRRAEAGYEEALSDLRRTAERERAAWPETQKRRFDEDFAAAQARVIDAREAARQGDRPRAEVADRLFEALQGEVAMLEEAAIPPPPDSVDFDDLQQDVHEVDRERSFVQPAAYIVDPARGGSR